MFQVPLTSVYAKDGMIAGRVVNDKVQMYAYDQKGQLLSVADMQGNIAEAYKYDPAGNILSKNIAGKITTFTYDKANQLVTSTVDDKVMNYAYDAAGRLVKEGSVASGFKTYSYGYLDKILEVQENGEQIAAFDYHIDGQIANSITKDGSESFVWDGLALIHRGDNSFLNEPYVTGGNPILSSKDGVMFNDLLGTTLVVKSGEQVNQVNMTAFGEPARPAANGDAAKNQDAFFTGKPHIGELGYAFLFRNYRPEQGKWQTADPLGYPDGWNNLAYVNNGATSNIDLLGGWTYNFSGDWTDAERTLFGQTMNQALIAIGRALNDLHNVINNHGSCGISSCACPLHSETSGLNNLRGILANTVSKLQGTDGLTVKKSDSMGNIAGTYNPGLFGNETMTVNSATGSAYNFFTSLPGTALTVAIHESSHAGGSNDYLNEHGSPDHKWDNAHTIENISNNGIKSILQAMGMPQNCLCE
jgi:RHS repeat-associated protein